MTNKTDKLINYNDAAAMMGVKIGTLYSMVARRQVPHLRLGPRLIRFSRAALEEWLDAHAVPPRSSRTEEVRP